LATGKPCLLADCRIQALKKGDMSLKSSSPTFGSAIRNTWQQQTLTLDTEVLVSAVY